jgi:hypothetical protein
MDIRISNLAQEKSWKPEVGHTRTFQTQHPGWTHDPRGWRSVQDVMLFGEVVLDTIPAHDIECANAIRRILDQLANAACEIESREFRKKK